MNRNKEINYFALALKELAAVFILCNIAWWFFWDCERYRANYYKELYQTKVDSITGVYIQENLAETYSVSCVGEATITTIKDNVSYAKKE